MCQEGAAGAEISLYFQAAVYGSGRGQKGSLSGRQSRNASLRRTCDLQRGTRRIARSKRKGINVNGETCTHYLTLTKEVLDNPDFNEASKYVCSPALRDQEDIDALWDALNSGLLTAISSDHCGIDVAELKQAGRNDFTQIPNGSPGAGDRFSMIWTYGVESGKISRQKFVELIAANPAKINGIFPQKGTLDVGSDADIVIFDPSWEGEVHLADNPNGVDYNIFEGRKQIGRVETVFLRGNMAVQNGNSSEDPAWDGLFRQKCTRAAIQAYDRPGRGAFCIQKKRKRVWRCAARCG